MVEQNGPASAWLRSSTLMPSSGSCIMVPVISRQGAFSHKRAGEAAASCWHYEIAGVGCGYGSARLFRLAAWLHQGSSPARRLDADPRLAGSRALHRAAGTRRLKRGNQVFLAVADQIRAAQAR